MRFIKKGAMFGLDARIALAIFGALSVISGAALYSAIQHAKVIKFVAQIEEVSKAIDAFRLDTGSEVTKFGFLRLGTMGSDVSYMGYLVSPANTSTYSGWNGPYLSGFVANPVWGVSKDNVTYTTSYMNDNRFESLDDGTSTQCPVNDRSDCNHYITLLLDTSLVDDSGDIAFLKKLDLFIDGTDSPLTGKLRFKQDSNSGPSLVPYTGSNPIFVYYKIPLSIAVQN